MIIVLRGTNGSGKTHAVRAVLEQAIAMRPMNGGIDGGNAPSTWIRLLGVKRPVVIVGPYIDGRSMGGCDCIRQPTQIYSVVEWAIDRGHHVLLEGVVLATKPWFKYLEQGEDVRYGFIDPGLARCLHHIEQRQQRKGRAVAVSQRAMQQKFDRAERMWIQARETGMTTARLTDANDAIRWTLKQLRNP